MSVDIMVNGENARWFKTLKINGRGGWQSLARRIKAGLYEENARHDQWTLTVTGVDFLRIGDYMRHPHDEGGEGKGGQHPGGGHQRYLMRLLGIDPHELQAKP